VKRDRLIIVAVLLTVLLMPLVLIGGAAFIYIDSLVSWLLSGAGLGHTSARLASGPTNTGRFMQGNPSSAPSVLSLRFAAVLFSRRGRPSPSAPWREAAVAVRRRGVGETFRDHCFNPLLYRHLACSPLEIPKKSPSRFAFGRNCVILSVHNPPQSHVNGESHEIQLDARPVPGPMASGRSDRSWGRPPGCMSRPSVLSRGGGKAGVWYGRMGRRGRALADPTTRHMHIVYPEGVPSQRDRDTKGGLPCGTGK